MSIVITDDKIQAEEKIESGSRNGFLSNFLSGIYYGFMALVIALLLATFLLPKLIGAVPLTVLSGSMSPTIKTGDLIVSKPVEDIGDINIGTIVTYRVAGEENTFITHRVVSVGITFDGKPSFITKGDANSEVDEPIVAEQIVGTYLYHVPYAGWIAATGDSNFKGKIVQFLGIVMILFAVGYVAYPKLKNRREKREHQTVHNGGKVLHE